MNTDQNQQPVPLDDDELPPVLGERYRDIVYDINRAAFNADQQ